MLLVVNQPLRVYEVPDRQDYVLLQGLVTKGQQFEYALHRMTETGRLFLIDAKFIWRK